MYVHYNKNNLNNIVKTNSEVRINEIEEKNLYKTSDFQLIYNSLVDLEYNNLKSLITSKNKIKEITVSGITIYTDDYLTARGINLVNNDNENKIMGYCVFSIEFEDIEGLTLAGSKGSIHEIIGNCLTEDKDFIFDRNTNKIELCTSIYTESQDESVNSKNTASKFDLVYNAIQNVDFNNIEDSYKKGKIKEITVNSIDIWEDNEYAKALNMEIPQEYKTENFIIGYCKYTIEFEDIGEVEFSGSKGNISKIVDNSYVDDKFFIYDKSTNKLEFCTSLYF